MAFGTASKQLDDAFNGGTSSPGALALASLGYSADQIAKLVAAASSNDKTQLALVTASMKSDPIKDLRKLTPPGGWVKAPRNPDGSVSHFIAGMEPCRCGVNGGQHVRRDRSAGCTLPDLPPGGGGGGGRRNVNGARGKAPAKQEPIKQESKVTTVARGGIDLNYVTGADVCDGDEVDAALAAQLELLYAGETTAVKVPPPQAVKAPAPTHQFGLVCEESADEDAGLHAGEPPSLRAPPPPAGGFSRM